MSSIKNIKGNDKSQKTIITPQNPVDPELGIKQELNLVSDVNFVVSENTTINKVKNDKTILHPENNKDDRQYSLNEERKTDSPQFDENDSDILGFQDLQESILESSHPEPSVISESFSEQEIYDKAIFDNHLSEINTHLSDINNKFVRGRTKSKRVLQLRKIEKKSKFIYDNFKLLKKINKESSTNIVIGLKTELNELKEYLNGKINTENKKNLDDFHTKIDHLYDKFKGKNIEQIEDIRNNDLKMNIKHEREFDGHLEKKLTFLSERLDLLQMKYNGYKQWYDRMNITIIIISTLLSVFESFRLEVDELIPENNHGLRLFFNMTPIAISSTITCAAAIIKFKKYQEKMENMQFTREKVITSISRIEYVKESLWFNEGDDDFHDIKQKYLSEVFIIYNESIAELKRHIKFNDPHKFDKRVSDNNKENYKNKNMYI